MGISAPTTRLHGRRLRLARLGWLVFIALDLLLFSLAIPATYQASLRQALTADNSALIQLGMSVQRYAALRTGLPLASTLLSAALALFLFASRSDDRMVLLVSLVFITVAPGTESALGTLAANQPAWLLPVALQLIIGLMATALLVFTFPTGRFVPAWTRLALLLFGVGVVAYLGVNVGQGRLADPTVAWIACYTLGVLAQVVRYRHTSDSIQRQQFRWIVFGFFLYAPSFTLFGLLGAFVAPSLPQAQRMVFELWGALVLFYIPALLLFLTAIFATLHYRLWDIDVIINRTLVYVPLTAILAGIFAASITFLQKLSAPITGQRSDAATLLTTLIVVTAFEPLKRGLQHLVDRRFQEQRNPVQQMNAFVEQVLEVLQVLDAGQVSGRFLEKAVAALDATGGAVYLQRNGSACLVQRTGAGDGEVRLSVLLECDGVQVVHVELGARKNGRPYADVERAALQLNAERMARALRVIQEL